MVLQFNDKIPNKKIVGLMNLDGLVYEYIIYLMPLEKTPLKTEVVSFFGNRIQDGKKCLKLEETDVENYINDDNPQVSAFIIVKQLVSNETASGTIQLHNWCNRTRGQAGTYQIWINDVCRIIEPTKEKYHISPLKAFFTLIEQFAIQKLGKNEVYLMVKKEIPIDGNDTTARLMHIYNINYGFVMTTCIEPQNISIPNSIVANYVTMKKDNIVANTSIVDLTSVVISGGGKRRKSRKVIKRRKSRKSRRY